MSKADDAKPIVKKGGAKSLNLKTVHQGAGVIPAPFLTRVDTYYATT